MMTDIQKLEKLVKEQNIQIDSLKKAMSGLMARLQIMDKKLNRTYQSGRKATMDLQKVTTMLGK